MVYPDRKKSYTSRPASVSWAKTQREASKMTARCSAPSFCKYRTVGPTFSSGSSSSALILKMTSVERVQRRARVGKKGGRTSRTA